VEIAQCYLKGVRVCERQKTKALKVNVSSFPPLQASDADSDNADKDLDVPATGNNEIFDGNFELSSTE
jgi:hypothetical protein